MRKELQRGGDAVDFLALSEAEAACIEAKLQLTVRQLFALNGSLRSFVCIQRQEDPNIDRCGVSLLEMSFSKTLGIEPDAEVTAIHLMGSVDFGRRRRR